MKKLLLPAALLSLLLTMTACPRKQKPADAWQPAPQTKPTCDLTRDKDGTVRERC